MAQQMGSERNIVFVVLRMNKRIPTTNELISWLKCMVSFYCVLLDTIKYIVWSDIMTHGYKVYRLYYRKSQQELLLFFFSLNVLGNGEL